jgi:outer membrane lipoprotein LolB
MIAECQPSAVDKSLILKGILLALCLSGCAVKPLQERPADLAFLVTGKFGIKDAQQGYSARFNWQQYNNGYAIEVWGPLGQGRTQLQGDSESMQVRRGDEVIAQGEPEDVMYTHLGWSVPIHVLPAWIQGRPEEAMAYEDVDFDETGQYASFSQAGWQVTLARYANRGGIGVDLLTPSRIVAQRGLRRVTVVVQEYIQ